MLKKLTAICISCLLLFGYVIPVSAAAFNPDPQEVLISDRAAAEEAYTNACRGIDPYAAWGPNDLKLSYRYTDTAQTTVQLRFLNEGFDPIDDCNLYVSYRRFGSWYEKTWNLGPIGVGVSVSQRCEIGPHDAAVAVVKATDGSESHSQTFKLK